MEDARERAIRVQGQTGGAPGGYEYIAPGRNITVSKQRQTNGNIKTDIWNRRYNRSNVSSLPEKGSTTYSRALRGSSEPGLSWSDQRLVYPSGTGVGSFESDDDDYYYPIQMAGPQSWIYNKGGSVPGYAKGGSWLKGILSLLSSNTPRWLTDLIGKTKGADEYVSKIVSPEDQISQFKKMIGYDEYVDKKAEEDEKLLEEALAKITKTEALLNELADPEIKSEADKLEELSERLIKKKPPTLHNSGGIAGLAKGGGFKFTFRKKKRGEKMWRYLQEKKDRLRKWLKSLPLSDKDFPFADDENIYLNKKQWKPRFEHETGLNPDKPDRQPYTRKYDWWDKEADEIRKERLLTEMYDKDHNVSQYFLEKELKGEKAGGLISLVN